MNLDGVRGFVPASQVSEIRGGDDASKQADMAKLIGTKLHLKVIEINRHRNRLILSERQAMQERRDEMKEKLIEELKEGEVRKGRVSSICDFGAFVDIGGADGLVHLSELSWSRVRHPSEILKVGQEVDVCVLGINPQEKKIALSLKRTQAEPWSQVGDKYEVGQLVRGAITQLANFGAFARIEDGIEGLIHVSEITDERITHPKQIVKEGDELILRIIRIDPQRRRMGLSLRRALDTPDPELLGVFGEGILEERDRIVEAITAALLAEGIEPGSGRDEEEDENREVGETGSESAEPRTPKAAKSDDAPSSAPASAEKPAPSAVQAMIAETQSSDREPMSAMEAAFAAAGAGNEEPAAAESAPDVTEAATPEVVAEAAPEVAEEAAPEVVEEVAPEVAEVDAPEVAAEEATEVVAEATVEPEAEAAVEEAAPEADADAPAEKKASKSKAAKEEPAAE